MTDNKIENDNKRWSWEVYLIDLISFKPQYPVFILKRHMYSRISRLHLHADQTGKSINKKQVPINWLFILPTGRWDGNNFNSIEQYWNGNYVLYCVLCEWIHLLFGLNRLYEMQSDAKEDITYMLYVSADIFANIIQSVKGACVWVCAWIYGEKKWINNCLLL